MNNSRLISRILSSHGSLAVIVCAVFFLIGMVTVSFYPPVNYNIGDEIWAVNASTAFVHEGAGSDDIVLPRIYFAALGGFISMTSSGIVAARVFTLICASLAMYLTYLLGRDTAGGWAGLSAVAVLGSSFGFFWNAHIVRPEMMSALFVLLSAWLLLSGINSRSAMKVFLSALVVTLSINVHPNNLQYAIASIPFYFIVAGRRAISAMAIYFGLGLLAGFALWVMTSYMPSQNGSVNVMALTQVSSSVPMPVKSKTFSVALVEAGTGTFNDFMDYTVMFNSFYPNHIDLRLPGVALVLLCAAGLFTQWRIYVVAMSGFVIMVDFIGYLVTKHMGYWHVIEFYPFAALALCIAMFGLKERLGHTLGRWVVYGALAFFILTGLADTGLTAYGMKDYDYARFMGKVARIPHGRALATDLYYPALGRDNYVSPWFGIDNPSANCPPVEVKIRELGVQYIVADDTLRAFSRLGCGEDYEREFVRYCMLKADLIATVDERYPNYWAPNGMISEINIFRTKP